MTDPKSSLIFRLNDDGSGPDVLKEVSGIHKLSSFHWNLDM